MPPFVYCTRNKKYTYTVLIHIDVTNFLTTIKNKEEATVYFYRMLIQTRREQVYKNYQPPSKKSRRLECLASSVFSVGLKKKSILPMLYIIQ